MIYDNENAIGMGRVVGDGIYFTIVDIVVRPEYQGKKIGTAIINSILNYIERNMYDGRTILHKAGIQTCAASVLWTGTEKNNI